MFLVSFHSYFLAYGAEFFGEQTLPCLYVGLVHNQRPVRELISGPCLGAKARVLSFNRTQSRTVTGLLIGHNTLRRHLHLMGLSDSPLCRRCGAQDETSAHILCECEALASLRHVYLCSFFLEPENTSSKSLVAIWNFSKARGLS
jgi:ferredoxin-thioredoxin reductase catalytic subunit